MTQILISHRRLQAYEVAMPSTQVADLLVFTFELPSHDSERISTLDLVV
jgi:hypothetical protein